jgi:hypothetical protein
MVAECALWALFIMTTYALCAIAAGRWDHPLMTPEQYARETAREARRRQRL